MSTIYGSEDPDILTGTSQRDHIYGGFGGDTIFGGGGQDYINPGTDHNIVYGGAGADQILGGDSDLVYGGAGSDLINSGRGFSSLYGGEGGDSFIINARSQIVFLDGGKGFDAVSYFQLYQPVVIDLIAGTEQIRGDVFTNVENAGGGQENDLLLGALGSNFLRGYDGADTLRGKRGHDELHGGLGDDIIDGGAGFDAADYSDLIFYIIEDGKKGMNIDLAAGTATGFQGSDTLISIEAVYGSNRNDKIFGDNKSNVLDGQEGSDKLYGRSGRDILYGDAGNDRLFGGGGVDTLVGEGGKDRLFGGAGGDTLAGQGGLDTLFGGDGRDFFMFGKRFDEEIVADFEDGIDTLLFFKNTFKNFSQIKAAATQVGDDLVIQGKGNDVLTVLDFDIGDLGASDIDFFSG